LNSFLVSLSGLSTAQVDLNGLDIRPGVLEQMGLPFRVVSGRIGKW
jgi:hypothetical protein